MMMYASELEAPYRYVISESILGPAMKLLSNAWAGGGTTSVHLAGRGVPRQGLAGLRGLGKEIWEDEDAQEYINRLRGEWKR